MHGLEISIHGQMPLICVLADMPVSVVRRLLTTFYT